MPVHCSTPRRRSKLDQRKAGVIQIPAVGAEIDDRSCGRIDGEAGTAQVQKIADRFGGHPGDLAAREREGRRAQRRGLVDFEHAAAFIEGAQAIDAVQHHGPGGHVHRPGDGQGTGRAFGKDRSDAIEGEAVDRGGAVEGDGIGAALFDEDIVAGRRRLPAAPPRAVQPVAAGDEAPAIGRHGESPFRSTRRHVRTDARRRQGVQFARGRPGGAGNWPAAASRIVSGWGEMLLWVADGVGFEPTVGLHLRRFSRPLPSTTRPPVPLEFL